MVLIENCEGRKSTISMGGPGRLIGEYLGAIYSKCCSAIIKKGNSISSDFEEELINIGFVKLPKIPGTKITLQKGNMTVKFEHKVIKKTKGTDEKGVEVDCEIINANNIEFFELKDESVHDSKKVSKEVETLARCGDYALKNGHTYSLNLCSFYAPTLKDVRVGLKHLVPEDKINLYTGRMLCKKLGIDYDTLSSKRNDGLNDNIRYFIKATLLVAMCHYRELLRGVLLEMGYELRKV